MSPSPPAWSDGELIRRQARSRRLAWAIGAVALILYGTTFWFR